MSDGDLSFSRFSGLILKHNLDLVKRELTLTGVITWKAFQKLDKRLKLLELHEGEINLVVNTGGGDIETTLAIIDRIKNSPNIINTTGIGIVMSAGVPILASGAKRSVTKNCRFMYHGAGLAVPYNRMPNAENELKYIKELSGTLDKILATETNKPYSFWAGLGKHVDHYFNAEEAKDLGLVDEIIGR